MSAADYILRFKHKLLAKQLQELHNSLNALEISMELQNSPTTEIGVRDMSQATASTHIPMQDTNLLLKENGFPYFLVKDPDDIIDAPLSLVQKLRGNASYNEVVQQRIEAANHIEELELRLESKSLSATLQPIVSAPKNQRILLYFPKLFGEQPYFCMGNWDTDRFSQNPRPYWTCDDERIVGRVDLRKRQPTHWMEPIAPTEPK